MAVRGGLSFCMALPTSIVSLGGYNGRMSGIFGDNTTTILAQVRLLAWYKDMGVDAAVSSDVTDWSGRADLKPGAGFELPQMTVPALPRPSAPQRPGPPIAPQRAAQASATHATPPWDEPGAAPSPTTIARPPLGVIARPRAAPVTPIARATEPRQFPTAAPDEAALAARDAARDAPSLEVLQQRLANFEGCGLKATAKNLCFFRGALRARLMIIGEAPRADDDKEGKPIVGSAGLMLDTMLAAIGLTEADVHVTNLIYWRPPGNRKATPQEILVCRPFLERQVALVQPKAILVLGGSAANQIFDLPGGIMKLRGTWREAQFGDQRVRALASLYPGDVLTTPVAKRHVWRDLLAIAAELDLPVRPTPAMQPSPGPT
jgi:uracil-DNA glycosylase